MSSTNTTDVSTPASSSSAGGGASPAPAASVAAAALLSRWEEVLLADTLRFSLDPAVARAKRVLHLADLEDELREEGKEDGW